MKLALRIPLLAIVLVAGTFIAAPAASAATIVVEPGESIQAAVNHASPGDTIVVRAGVFHEFVAINKDP